MRLGAARKRAWLFVAGRPGFHLAGRALCRPAAAGSRRCLDGGRMTGTDRVAGLVTELLPAAAGAALRLFPAAQQFYDFLNHLFVTGREPHVMHTIFPRQPRCPAEQPDPAHCLRTVTEKEKRIYSHGRDLSTQNLLKRGRSDVFQDIGSSLPIL